MAFWNKRFTNKQDDLPEDREVLWWESVQGMSGGKRVHMGQQAFYLPAGHRVVIEYWGGRAPKRECFPIPPELDTKSEIVAYMKERTYVPSGTLERIRREEAAAEQKE